MLQLPPWIRAESAAGEAGLPRAWYEGMASLISLGAAYLMMVTRQTVCPKIDKPMVRGLALSVCSVSNAPFPGTTRARSTNDAPPLACGPRAPNAPAGYFFFFFR